MFKAKIKVFTQHPLCNPTINEKGDWIDLYSAENVVVKTPQAGVQYERLGQKYRDVEYYKGMVSLGISIELPKGYEAIIAPRSSSFKYWEFIVPHSIGIIDNTYCGEDDIWKLPILMFGNSQIKEGDKICQFRIQLSQKATIWQKIKWLFTSGTKIEYVDHLDGNNRGGFGSTGTK